MLKAKIKKALWHEAVIAIFLGIFCVYFAWDLLGGAQVSFNIPFIYGGGDGQFCLLLIKRLIDGVWYLNNTALGYPFSSELYDYANSDFLNLVVLKIIGLITANAVKTYNIYFLLSFFVTSIVTFYILRHFNISKIFSVVGSILFTFLPFHFLRLEHLFYTWYFTVPIFTWYSLKIFSTPPLFFQMSLRAKIFHAIVLLCLSSFGVYFAFFGVLMFFTAGAIASFQQQTWTNLVAAIIAISIVSLGVGLNLIPKAVYQVVHGKNPGAIVRQKCDAELYGLKITQLLLPRPEHRLKKFEKITRRYISSFPLVNENKTATLGLLGDVGFLIMMGVLLVRKPKEKINQQVVILASITLVLVLCATIGGFSSLFSFFITSLIRGWNRISLFIAFMSITTLMLLIDIYLKQKFDSKYVGLFAGATLILFGLWDQTVPHSQTYSNNIRAEFVSDQNFIQQVEQTLPLGSAIYQFPYLSFPEVPPQYDLQTYGLAKGYIHSRHLKWSYAGMKGRDGDKFFIALSRKELPLQIKIIKLLGFNAIYVDRRGYGDHGVEIEKELSKLIGKTKKVVSNDGHLVLFILPEDKETKKYDLEQIKKILNAPSVATIRDGIDFRQPEIPSFVKEIEGLSDNVEVWGRWSDANNAPTLKIILKKTLPKDFILMLRAQAFGPNVGQKIIVKIGDQTNFFIPKDHLKKFFLRFKLNKENAKTIEIIVPRPTAPSEIAATTDNRKLGIGLEQLKILNYDN